MRLVSYSCAPSRSTCSLSAPAPLKFWRMRSNCPSSERTSAASSLTSECHQFVSKQVPPLHDEQGRSPVCPTKPPALTSFLVLPACRRRRTCTTLRRSGASPPTLIACSSEAQTQMRSGCSGARRRAACSPS
eukprot:6211095-Pleurochrysis_carterae.AAC.2